MILNCSRAKVALTCWRKAFNHFHRSLEGPRSMNLVNGGAFHEAVAHGLATPADKNWDKAVVEARRKFDEGVAAAGFLDVELWKVEQHWEVVVKMIEHYRDNYEREEYTIVQPECSFDVALPNTHHNCIFVHHLELVVDNAACAHWEERWGPPTPSAIMEKRVASPHDPKGPNGMLHSPELPQACKCWQPHRLVGKTDAVIKWKGTLWLLEHKTSAIKGDQFWDQWHIDMQPTTYIYGIWKSLGIRPRGFVLDMIWKPSDKQIQSWNAKRTLGGPGKSVLDYMDYERQAFLRTEEDLARCEQQYIDIMNEWEMRIAGPLAGVWPMANAGSACKLYNRRCDYWTACLTHDDPKEFEALGVRPDDYVVDKLYNILPALKEADV